MVICKIGWSIRSWLSDYKSFSFYKSYCRHDIYWLLVAFMIAASALIKVSRLYGLYRHLYTQLIYWHCAVILYTHVNLLNKRFWILKSWIPIACWWVTHDSDVIMSSMALKSSASRLFAQQFVQAQVKETPKLRVTGLCEGNSLVTGEFPAQRASNAENVSIWWRHHDTTQKHVFIFPKTIQRIKDEFVNTVFMERIASSFFIYLRLSAAHSVSIHDDVKASNIFRVNVPLGG